MSAIDNFTESLNAYIEAYKNNQECPNDDPRKGELIEKERIAAERFKVDMEDFADAAMAFVQTVGENLIEALKKAQEGMKKPGV